MTGLAWTADVAAFAETASRETDPEALTSAFKTLLLAKGMKGFACGEVDLRDLSRTVMVAADWPQDWMELYAAEGLVQHDPAVSALGRLTGLLSWDNLKDDSRRSRMVMRSLEAAEDYGWRDGLFIPFPRGGSRWGLATMTGMEGTLSPSERSELAVALILYYERIRGLTAGKAPAKSFSGLTARELDCLSLVAQGYDDQMIADRLTIARSTAHDHVERAKRRLHVRTRTEAVAIALSLGLIVL